MLLALTTLRSSIAAVRPPSVARLTVLACCLGLATNAGAQVGSEVTRGPYLQRASPTSIIVRWRTASASDAVVALGDSPGTLVSVATLPGATTEHRVALSGLLPDHLYYYSIGSSTGVLAGGDAAHAFRNAPGAGSTRSLRLWAFGDGGLPTEQALAVRDAYLADPGNESTDAWLLLGDNGYTTGTDAELQAGLFTPFAAPLARTALWPVLGNHDAVSSDSATQTGPFFDSFSLPRLGESGGVPSGTEAYYAFDLGEAHFVALDTADSDLTPGGAMLTWLIADLTRNTKPWVVAFFHHPPYTKGSHDSDNPADSEGRMIAVRTQVLPILECFGVALVLSGHSHAYERSFLLAGHFGDSTTFSPTMMLDAGDGDPSGDGAYLRARRASGGTVYAVAGAVAFGGSGPLDHPAMARSLPNAGSLVLDITGNQLLARYLDVTGIERDHFAIVHDEVFFEGFEGGTVTEWTLNP
ncbi:MAG: metallophosphoesterase family protein [Holophagales bacterium]|nr:MAG: metallophosphoesterase family protein [Holophagales bacterium]